MAHFLACIADAPVYFINWRWNRYFSVNIIIKIKVEYYFIICSTIRKYVVWVISMQHSHLLLLAPGRQTQHGARVCRLQSHWRRCWRSRHRRRWFYHLASDHQAGCHALDSTAPSRRYQSGHRPDRRGHWYIHAGKQRGIMFSNQDRTNDFCGLGCFRLGGTEHIIHSKSKRLNFLENCWFYISKNSFNFPRQLDTNARQTRDGVQVLA